jgi:hypothetical protein
MDTGPAVLAANAVTTATENALELGFRQVNYRQAADHGNPFLNQM